MCRVALVSMSLRNHILCTSRPLVAIFTIVSPKKELSDWSDACLLCWSRQTGTVVSHARLICLPFFKQEGPGNWGDQALEDNGIQYNRMHSNFKWKHDAIMVHRELMNLRNTWNEIDIVRICPMTFSRRASSLERPPYGFRVDSLDSIPRIVVSPANQFTVDVTRLARMCSQIFVWKSFSPTTWRCFWSTRRTDRPRRRVF